MRISDVGVGVDNKNGKLFYNFTKRGLILLFQFRAQNRSSDFIQIT
jgi:hypothetical protein